MWSSRVFLAVVEVVRACSVLVEFEEYILAPKADRCHFVVLGGIVEIDPEGLCEGFDLIEPRFWLTAGEACDAE